MHACLAHSRIPSILLGALIFALAFCQSVRARTGPGFYERKVVPIAGRHYCIAKRAADPKVTIQVFLRHADLPLPLPAAKRHPLESLAAKPLPIDRDLSPDPLDSLVREETFDIPPLSIKVSSTRLGVALIGAPTHFDTIETFENHPFITIVPLQSDKSFKIMLPSFLRPEEIEERTTVAHSFHFIGHSWIDEKRHRLILTEYREKPPKTIVLVDMLDGKTQRGTTEDIVESLDNGTIDSLFPALLTAGTVPGIDVDNRLTHMMNDTNQSIGVRALAARTLQSRGNPAGDTLIRELHDQRSKEILRDPRTEGWMRLMPDIAEEIGFTREVDEWSGLWEPE